MYTSTAPPLTFYLSTMVIFRISIFSSTIMKLMSWTTPKSTSLSSTGAQWRERTHLQTRNRSPPLLKSTTTWWLRILITWSSFKTAINYCWKTFLRKTSDNSSRISTVSIESWKEKTISLLSSVTLDKWKKFKPSFLIWTFPKLDGSQASKRQTRKRSVLNTL